jgi:hypothetical protein
MGLLVIEGGKATDKPQDEPQDKSDEKGKEGKGNK